jgi:hypothetical protein
VKVGAIIDSDRANRAAAERESQIDGIAHSYERRREVCERPLAARELRDMTNLPNRCHLFCATIAVVLTACGSRAIDGDTGADHRSDSGRADAVDASPPDGMAIDSGSLDGMTIDSSVPDVTTVSDGSDASPVDAPTETGTVTGDSGRDATDAATTICAAGATRCSPSDPRGVDTCASDGSGWLSSGVCDASAHQVCSDGACVAACDAGSPSNVGCEFWPTVTVNSQLTNDFSFAVVLVNPQTYAVTVTVSGGALTTPVTRTIAPGASSAISLPWVAGLAQLAPDPVSGCGGAPCIGVSAQASHGAYRVQADGPVAAYQFNPLEATTSSSNYSFTNDASLLLPTRSLTTHYTVVTRDNWHVRNANDGTLLPYILGGFVSIVGTSATPTSVTVNLTAGVSAGVGVTASGAGTRTFTLQQGDVVQLVGSGDGEDLTGTTIVADQPVAVFAGHDCTNVPEDVPACDHLEEQLLPNEAWGRRAVLGALRDRGDAEERVVRIVSNGSALHLAFDGIATPTDCTRVLAAGQHCEFRSAASFTVSGDQPFAAIQFMFGQGVADPVCSTAPSLPMCMGDPASALELPVEQYRSSYDIVVPDTYSRNFVNVMRSVGTDVLLDGVSLTGAAMPAGSAFEVLAVPIMPGAHHIATAAASDAPIGIQVYGVAAYTSYMYPGGVDLSPISPAM